MKEIPSSPEHTVELLDQAFAQGDLETVLSFYDDAAVIFAGPSQTARGASELRVFFESAMRAGNVAKQIKTRVAQADGIALFLSRWTLAPMDARPETLPQTLIAMTVFRKQPDGKWKILIDMPFGPHSLDWE